MKTMEELKREKEEYAKFMYNEKNKLPCGQQNCWVYCHIKDL